MALDNFTAWIKWHGPYRTRSQWKRAAESLEINDRLRLYCAIGRWKLFSLAFSRPLYIGLSAKDSANSSVAQRIKKHTTPEESEKHKKITGLLNEYWLGEIMTRWHYCRSNNDSGLGCGREIDTCTNGLTADVEKALIFSIAPIINKLHVKNPPANFGFQIINEIASKSLFRKLFKTRFESIVCNLYRLENDTLTYGDIKLSDRKTAKVDKIRKLREDRLPPSVEYKKILKYRVFGAGEASGQIPSVFNE